MLSMLKNKLQGCKNKIKNDKRYTMHSLKVMYNKYYIRNYKIIIKKYEK